MRLVRTLVRAALALAGVVLMAIAAGAEPLSELSLTSFLVDQVAQKYQVPRDRVDIAWEGPSLTTLLAGTLQPGAEVTYRIEGQPRLLGRTSVPVAVQGKEEKRILYPRVAIKVWQDVWVVTQPIHRGQTFDPSLVRTDRKGMDQVMGTSPKSLDSLVGAVAKREVLAGQVLVAEAFDLPMLVKGGSMVTVKLMSGDLTIVTRGQVVGNGAIGQLVRVINPDTHKDFTARVTGPDTVEVNLEDTP